MNHNPSRIKLTQNVRDFFHEFDRVPKFVFVGHDIYEEIIADHADNREFYNVVKVNTAFGQRPGAEVKAAGFSVLILPMATLQGQQLKPEQVLR